MIDIVRLKKKKEGSDVSQAIFFFNIIASVYNYGMSRILQKTALYRH